MTAIKIAQKEKHVTIMIRSVERCAVRKMSVMVTI